MRILVKRRNKFLKRQLYNVGHLYFEPVQAANDSADDTFDDLDFRSWPRCDRRSSICQDKNVTTISQFKIYVKVNLVVQGKNEKDNDANEDTLEAIGDYE